MPHIRPHNCKPETIPGNPHKDRCRVCGKFMKKREPSRFSRIFDRFNPFKKPSGIARMK